MTKVPTASALGQRHFPQLAEICDRQGHRSARHNALSPILVLLLRYLASMLRSLDRLALRLQHPPARPSPRPPAEPLPVAGHIQPSGAGRPANREARPIRLRQPMAQPAARPVDAPVRATAPAPMQLPAAPREPRPLRPRIPHRPDLPASARRRRKPPA